MIQFQNVSKTDNQGEFVLRNITFEVAEGDIVALTGPLGGGKTTLLRSVSKFKKITSGDIKINGQSIQTMSKTDLLCEIGYINQNVNLFPQMTIEDNVMILPNLLGWDSRRKKDRYNQVMEKLGLCPEEYRNEYPYDLAFGIQLKLIIARVLATDPSVILMEKPFDWVNARNRSRIVSKFLNIQLKIKKTILIDCDDIESALKFGDKIAYIQFGELMQYDRRPIILHKPANKFVAHFVGEDSFSESLYYYTISDVARVMPLQEVSTSPKTEAVPIGTPLKFVLSLLIMMKTDHLNVTDRKEKKIGSITRQQIKDFLRR